MKKSILLAISIGAFALFLGKQEARAKGVLGYNVVGVSYLYSNFDESAFDDGNGVLANFSVSPADYFFIFGAYGYSKADFEATNVWGQKISGEVETQVANLGVGGYYPVHEKIHLVGNVAAAYTKAEASAEGNSADNDEIGLATGFRVRGAVLDMLELSAGVTFTYFDIDDGETLAFNVGTVVDITNNLSLIASYSIDDDSNMGASVGALVSW